MTSETRPGQGGDDIWERIGTAEYYPTVGQPEEKLRLAGTFFPPDVIDIAKKLGESFPGRGIRFSSTIPQDTGEPPKILAVEIVGTEPVVSVDLFGDWGDLESLRGTPLLATFNGKIYRARNENDFAAGTMISEPGQELAPNQPIAFAMAGKNQHWLYRLPARLFPQGARLVRFSSEFDPSNGSLEVQKGATPFCWVEKI